jgi:hypothetical protein
MKCFFLLLILNFFNSSAQVSEQELTNRKITQIYGEEVLNSNPLLVKELTILLDERIEFLKTPFIEGEIYEVITKNGQVEAKSKDIKIYLGNQFNSRLFNPLLYNISTQSKKPVLYRIDGTDYLMLIHPID